MTQFSTRRSPAGIFALIALALAVIIGFGCGDDNASTSGEIRDLAVTPAAGYPDVELAVTFAIDAEDAQDLSWRVDFDDGNALTGEDNPGEARHRYDDVGDYTIRVEALDGGSVIASDSIEFPVYDPVDLSADSVRAQPANIRVDETVTISFDVSNQTASPILTDIPVRAYLALDTATTRENFRQRLDDEELYPVGDQTLSVDDEGIALEGGQQRNISINSPVPEIPTGTYHAVVIVDPDDQLADRTPDDTVASSTASISVENLDEGLPNLAVEQLEVAPERAFPELNEVTRAFTLRNAGGEDIFNVVHRTYLQVGSAERDDDALLIHESDPINLFAGAEESIGPEAFVLSDPIIPDAQEQEVYVIVEAFSEDGDVEETTLANNVATSNPPITVSDEPVDGPDIAVDGFSITPNATYLGGTLAMEVTVANEGTDDVGSFFCGIYMGNEATINPSNDPQVSTLAVTGLDAGSVGQYERDISIPAVYDPGTYYFYIVCDPAGAIDQPYRGNSQALQTDPVTISDEADIDLYVADIEVPASADDGDTITATTTFCVNGSNPSGATTGELYANAGDTVDFEADPIATFDVANINPAECRDVEITFDAQCQGFDDRLAIGAVADAGEALPDEDRGNNRGNADDPVLLSGPYCQCEEDEFAPNQSPFATAILDAGSYAGALCEPAECDYYSVTLNENESLLVNTDFDAERGPLETTLFAPNGVQQLDSDSSDDHQEVGLFLAGEDDLDYVIEVCGGTNDAQNYYDLHVDVVEQPADVDVLPRNIDLPANDTYSVGAVVDVDLRIYNLGQQVTGPFDVDLVLTTARELGGADDIFLGSHSIDSIDAGDFRDLTLPAPLTSLVADGDYFIAVVLDEEEALAETNRDNNLGFTPAITLATSCYDPFTPNDSFSSAASLEPGTYSNLVACADKSDYFEICVPNGTTLDATATFDSAQGEIDTTLYNQALEAVDSSSQTGVGSETVSVDYVDGAQCYYLRVLLVSLQDDAENDYSLDIDVNDVDPDLLCDPTFEPNDFLGSATSLWAALDYESTINRCPKNDVDFYYVELSPSSIVDFSATLSPSNQPGTLRLQLYGPNQVPIETVETSPGIPTAAIDDFDPPTTGTYYLRVSVTGDEHRVNYELSASGLPGVDLAIEELRIGPGTYVENDVIRYEFALQNFGGDDVSTVDYEIYLSSSQTVDPANDQLLGSSTLNDIAADSSQEIDGQLNLPTGVSAGDYYFHIIIDPDDATDDVNQNNNRAQVSLPVVDGSDGDGDST